MSNKKIIRISASKLKTYCSCSYFFYQNYLLRTPQTQHKALPTGTCIHLVLELLLVKSKRHFLIPLINKQQSLRNFPSIVRLIEKHLKKNNLEDPLTYLEIEKCILTGLAQDFLCKGAIKVQGEYEFNVPLEDNIVANGFMDKIAIYKDKIVIFDYKSNRQKFSGDEQEANTQAFIYLAVAKKLFPEYKNFELRFIFLRFPRNPIQIHKYSDSEINGFTQWAIYLARQIEIFKESDADSNYAYDDVKKKWMCFAGKTWACPYLNPFPFYSLYDDKGNLVEKTLTKPQTIQKNYKVIQEQYLGCPRHMKRISAKAMDDFFEIE